MYVQNFPVYLRTFEELLKRQIPGSEGTLNTFPMPDKEEKLQSKTAI